MRHLNSDEAWRQIPPEEKLEIMARAHAKGLAAAAFGVVVAGTCAAALQVPSLLWAALLGAPLIFQFSAGKAWRAMKPATVLRYLAARSAARRYAYAARSKALNLVLLFRGGLEHVYSDQEIEKTLSALADDIKQTEVWVALFEDTVIMLSEKPGGAALEFSHVISSRLDVSSNDNGGYSADKEVFLTYKDKDERARTLKLTSPFPAALIVFEKEYHALREKNKGVIASKVKAIAKQARIEDDDDRLDNLSMLGGGDF